jgi:hypothetical protein
MDEAAFLVELSTIYPDDRLLTKQAQLVTYESDALTSYHVRPLAVVLPETQIVSIKSFVSMLRTGSRSSNVA